MKNKNIVLVLDPGHGGVDFGASGNKIIESHRVLQYALSLQYSLPKIDSSIKVLLTRTMNTKPNFRQRADIVRDNAADLVISLHINASTNVNASGLWLFHQHNNPVAKTLC